MANLQNSQSAFVTWPFYTMTASKGHLEILAFLVRTSKYSWLLNNVGHQNPEVKTLCITYRWPSVPAVLLYRRFLCIHSFTSLYWTNLGLCSTIVFTIEKNPNISGLAQFKPMLFKSQLYMQHFLKSSFVFTCKQLLRKMTYGLDCAIVHKAPTWLAGSVIIGSS